MRGLGSLLSRFDQKSIQANSAGETWGEVVMPSGANAPALRAEVYRGGMGIPGAWRAAILLADLLGAVPWHAYRERAGRPVQRIEPTPPIIAQPSWPDTRMTTFSSWGLDLIWHGNAVGLIAARNAEGWPTATVPVSADQVAVRRVRRGDGSPFPPGTVEYITGGQRYPSHDVIHIKGPCRPGALRGFGVLEAHMATLELAHEQNGQARSLSRHGVPTGVLKSENPDLTEDEATELKRKWMETQSTRTIAVLNQTTDFTALAWNPEELQLVEARKFTLHELALIFGLPASFLNVESSNRTYRNDETESINLVKFSLGGHLARFEQTLAGHLPRGTWVKANLDAVLRADTKSRYEAHKIALDTKFLTVPEVREIEDLPPIEEVS